MVSLDRKQRSAVFSFWRRVFICLIIFAITYLVAIRPAQKMVLQDYIFPAALNLFDSSEYVSVAVGNDELFLTNKKGSKNTSTKIEILFNGFILLALTLLLASRNRGLIHVLLIYQLILLIVYPFLAWLIIKDQVWLLFILNFHEKAHKAVFLIMGLLSVKSKADSVSAGKTLNK